MSARTLVAALVAALLGSLVPPAAIAGTETRAPVAVRPIEGDYNDGEALPLQPTFERRSLRASSRAAVGDVKLWLALDDERGTIYLKEYRLRGIGEHMEVWVAVGSDEVSSGTAFPAGDCRNDERIRITRAQVNSFIHEFDTNTYPKESRAFSIPPERDGTGALLAGQQGIPRNYWRGDGSRIVTLIDNVRDDNFYDTNNSMNNPYIAGFFYSVFNNSHDRNVMTIDAFDWLHRSGPTPPDDPVPDDLCANASARPYLYEGIFAHEYQHLLEHYEDPGETTWVNEGLADWAQSLTGYAFPRKPVTEIGFDSHVWGFLGFLATQTPANPNPRLEGGPENSLTLWSDQGGAEILSDYGATYTFMELLASRYGRDFMRTLHRANANGFAGLSKALAREGVTKTPQQLVHEWLAAVALDGLLDDGATLYGAESSAYSVRTLQAIINWDSPESHASDGAPPNGADFIRLRDATDNLGAGAIQTISFAGQPTPAALDPNGVTGWTVQLVAWDDAHTAAWYYELPLAPDGTGTLSGTAVTDTLGDYAQNVGAIVTYDDPAETISSYGRYTLTVNGHVQAGG